MRRAGDVFMEPSREATVQGTTIQLVLQQAGPPAASDLHEIKETSKGLQLLSATLSDDEDNHPACSHQMQQQRLKSGKSGEVRMHAHVWIE